MQLINVFFHTGVTLSINLQKLLPPPVSFSHSNRPDEKSWAGRIFNLAKNYTK